MTTINDLYFTTVNALEAKAADSISQGFSLEGLPVNITLQINQQTTVELRHGSGIDLKSPTLVRDILTSLPVYKQIRQSILDEGLMVSENIVEVKEGNTVVGYKYKDWTDEEGVLHEFYAETFEDDMYGTILEEFLTFKNTLNDLYRVRINEGTVFKTVRGGVLSQSGYMPSHAGIDSNAMSYFMDEFRKYNGALFSLVSNEDPKLTVMPLCVRYAVHEGLLYKVTLQLNFAGFLSRIASPDMIDAVYDDNGPISKMTVLDTGNRSVVTGTVEAMTMCAYSEIPAMRVVSTYHLFNQLRTEDHVYVNSSDLDFKFEGIGIKGRHFRNVRETCMTKPWVKGERKNSITTGEVPVMMSVSKAGTIASHKVNFSYIPNSTLRDGQIRVGVSEDIFANIGDIETFAGFSAYWSAIVSGSVKPSSAPDAPQMVFGQGWSGVCMPANYEYINSRAEKPMITNYLSIKIANGKDFQNIEVLCKIRAYIVEFLDRLIGRSNYFVGAVGNGPDKTFLYSPNSSKIMVVQCMLHRSTPFISGAYRQLMCSTKSQPTYEAGDLQEMAGRMAERKKFISSIVLRADANEISDTINNILKEKNDFIMTHMRSVSNKDFFNLGLTRTCNLGTDVLKKFQFLKFNSITADEMSSYLRNATFQHANPFKFDVDAAHTYFSEGRNYLAVGGPPLPSNSRLVREYIELMGRCCYVSFKNTVVRGNSNKISDNGDFANYEHYVPSLPEAVTNVTRDLVGYRTTNEGPIKYEEYDTNRSKYDAIISQYESKDSRDLNKYYVTTVSGTGALALAYGYFGRAERIRPVLSAVNRFGPRTVKHVAKKKIVVTVTPEVEIEVDEDVLDNSGSIVGTRKVKKIVAGEPYETIREVIDDSVDPTIEVVGRAGGRVYMPNPAAVAAIDPAERRATDTNLKYLYFGSDFDPNSMSFVVLNMFDFVYMLGYVIDRFGFRIQGTTPLRDVDLDAVYNTISDMARGSRHINNNLTAEFPTQRVITNVDDIAAASNFLIGKLINAHFVVESKIPRESDRPIGYDTYVNTRIAMLKECFDGNQ